MQKYKCKDCGKIFDYESAKTKDCMTVCPRCESYEIRMIGCEAE